MRTLPGFAMMLACFLCARPTGAAAGAHTPMGATIEAVELPSASGGKVSIAGSAKANVLLFFRPDQHTFAGTLEALAACEKELAGQSVRWVALVPARFSAREAKAAADAAGLRMPVLIDEGDAVHGRIGIAMHPTVAILDGQHRLAQFQPFAKLNFCEAVMARIRRVLGELDDAGLQRALDPSAGSATSRSSASRRDLKLAEMLLRSGNLAKALEVAKKGVQNDPSSAAAQAMVGRVLAAAGDCRAAVAAFDRSLELDPNRGDAQAGKRACAGSR
ncbi:MAG TPA: tetratricopeptide repeat protein [Myxococcales bacterium]|nr:tetratricopeptide repeat protein [Myxococcales bacterium]